MNIDNDAFARAFFMHKNKGKEQENEEEGGYRLRGEYYDQKRKFMRNEFKIVGRYGMPVIKKVDISPEEIDLICFNKTKADDKNNLYKTIHFFTHDWHFNNYYENAEKTVDRLKQYYAVLTPDFSTYPKMPLVLQMYSTFKNRWCGAYWQSLGLKVIPTIEWGEENSFDFCFDGVEQGSTVAVATYYRNDVEGFLKGYNKMLEVIKPKAIICYGEEINGMSGNIKFISPYDYQELIAKLGKDEYLRRYMEGDLYPSR